MTEEDWLRGSSPGEMPEIPAGVATDRKLRLFVCACARRVWDLLRAGDESRRAVEVAEGYAGSPTSPAALEVARSAVASKLELYPDEPAYDPAYWACGPDMAEDAWRAAFYAADVSTRPCYDAGGDEAQAERVTANEERLQAGLLRDIFGNPFRPVAADPAWLTSPVLDLALTMYDSRDFQAMPILADALVEGRCDNPDVLNHCRGGGPHVRGCWVVELLLGKD